jgi:hypothetical protein
VSDQRKRRHPGHPPHLTAADRDLRRYVRVYVPALGTTLSLEQYAVRIRERPGVSCWLLPPA